jgi:hypothetical protein
MSTSTENNNDAGQLAKMLTVWKKKPSSSGE